MAAAAPLEIKKVCASQGCKIDNCKDGEIDR